MLQGVRPGRYLEVVRVGQFADRAVLVVVLASHFDFLTKGSGGPVYLGWSRRLCGGVRGRLGGQLGPLGEATHEAGVLLVRLEGRYPRRRVQPEFVQFWPSTYVW